MSAKHRVSQIILLFGYRYRLHQVILGIQGESSCYMSVIKSLDHKMTMGLMEAKKIVDDLTIQYDMNNIYRIRLVE